MVSFSLNGFMLNRKVYRGCLIWPTLYMHEQLLVQTNTIHRNIIWLKNKQNGPKTPAQISNVWTPTPVNQSPPLRARSPPQEASSQRGWVQFVSLIRRVPEQRPGRTSIQLAVPTSALLRHSLSPVARTLVVQPQRTKTALYRVGRTIWKCVWWHRKVFYNTKVFSSLSRIRRLFQLNPPIHLFVCVSWKKPSLWLCAALIDLVFAILGCRITSLHVCIEYLTVIKFKTSFLLPTKYWTFWHMNHLSVSLYVLELCNT